jgi:hypothetical protein
MDSTNMLFFFEIYSADPTNILQPLKFDPVGFADYFEFFIDWKYFKNGRSN